MLVLKNFVQLKNIEWCSVW